MRTWLEHHGRRMVRDELRALWICPECGGVVTDEAHVAKWAGLTPSPPVQGYRYRARGPRIRSRQRATIQAIRQARLDLIERLVDKVRRDADRRAEAWLCRIPAGAQVTGELVDDERLGLVLDVELVVIAEPVR